MDDSAPLVIYEFEGFELDPRRGVLRRPSDREALTLTPKAFGTLLYLVERAGELIEKDALFAAVWPNVVVEEGNLTQTIHVLRRALGEHRDDHRFIVTVPGRGYRFVADVTARPVHGPDRLGAPGPPASANGAPIVAAPAARALWADRRQVKSFAAAAVALALVAVGLAVYLSRGLHGPAGDVRPRSIAVLPFVDLSPAGDSAYFSDGLAEDVLNLLSQAPELRVIARTSSFSFRNRDADIPTIARALGVRYLLEGSVRREGRRVRITAQLIEASNSSHLWSAAYERELDDVFAVQSEIAAAVAEALETRLASSDRPAKKVAPVDSRAHDDFLRGQFFYRRRGPGDLQRALHYYERSVALDPNYARAWAGVAAIVAIETAEGRVRRETGLPRWLDAATKAVALDPDLAEGHVRLAWYYEVVGDGDRAEAHWRKALTLEPANPMVLGIQAGSAAEQGRLDQAIAFMRRAAAVDPLSALTLGNLGHFLFAAGRLEEARVELLRAYDLSPATAEDTLGQILILQRKFDAALALIERSAPGPGREQGLALVYHALGRTAEANAALARLTALSATEDPFRLAEVYAYRGNADESFRWLELAARPIDPELSLLPGVRGMWEMRASPFLASLHADPRWTKWANGAG